MSRKALIIAVPEAPGEDHLPGASVDGSRWRDWLASDNAGAWEQGEVELLVNPTIAVVRARIEQMRVCEYTFVACSGHGRHLRDATLGTSYDTFVLGDGHEIKENELIPRNGKATLLMDSCRKVEEVLRKLASDARMKTAAFVERDMHYRFRCKEMFNNHVRQCPSGTIKLKACSLNGTASEDPEGRTGGFFTFAMITPSERRGATISANLRKPIIDLRDAFNLAVPIVQELEPNQMPVFEPGRRSDFYPFAVYP